VRRVGGSVDEEGEGADVHGSAAREVAVEPGLQREIELQQEKKIMKI
jgi:hypothetical protein